MCATIPAAEKSVPLALARPIEELRRQDDVLRRVSFLQAAHRRHAENPAHAERPQRPDIRAMIQLVRQDAVAPRVPRQEKHLPPRDAPAENRVRRRAERRLHVVLGWAR